MIREIRSRTPLRGYLARSTPLSPENHAPSAGTPAPRLERCHAGAFSRSYGLSERSGAYRNQELQSEVPNSCSQTFPENIPVSTLILAYRCAYH